MPPPQAANAERETSWNVLKECLVTNQVVCARCDSNSAVAAEAERMGIVPDKTYCIIGAGDFMGPGSLMRLRGFAGAPGPKPTDPAEPRSAHFSALLLSHRFASVLQAILSGRGNGPTTTTPGRACFASSWLIPRTSRMARFGSRDHVDFTKHFGTYSRRASSATDGRVSPSSRGGWTRRRAARWRMSRSETTTNGSSPCRARLSSHYSFPPWTLGSLRPWASSRRRSWASSYSRRTHCPTLGVASCGWQTRVARSSSTRSHG